MYQIWMGSVEYIAAYTYKYSKTVIQPPLVSSLQNRLDKEKFG